MSVATPRPLDGVRVVDFTRLLPGPYASLVLAELGAEIVKVEQPPAGDWTRNLPPMQEGTSCAFRALHAGKRSFGVNLKDPDGAEVTRKLCATADVVMESFRPGVMDRLGLGHEALRAERPSLIYCAITGYGQDGPLAQRAGHDLNYLGLAGALGLSGPPEGPPSPPPVQVADLAGGALWPVVRIVAALHGREATGQGAFIDASMTDGVLSLLTMGLAGTVAAGAPVAPRGLDTLTGGLACYRVYETKDGGFMSLGALEPKFWRAFCDAVERPDLVRRQFGSPATMAEVRAEVAEIFKGRDRSEWETLFNAVDACCEPVLAPDEVADHPLHVARRAVVADSDGFRRLRTPAYDLDGPATTPAPALGGDTAELLEELGVASSTAAEWMARWGLRVAD